MNETTKTKIKFNKFNVKNLTTGDKARVWYSFDNRADGRKCVTVWAKDYDSELNRFFNTVKNDTDSMTDYYETDRVHIYETDSDYAQIRSTVEGLVNK